MTTNDTEISEKSINDMSLDEMRDATLAFLMRTSERLDRLAAEHEEERKQRLAAQEEERKQRLAAQEEEKEHRNELRDEINKWVGYFGNSIGYIMEAVLIPGIKPKMNELGHNFTTLATRKKYFKDKGRAYVEVDLYLENCEEVMIVEVKTQLSVKGVERQLKRLKLLRENESEKSLKGKVLYSAVAGMEIDDDAREMALELGMYVVEMVEDTKYVNVIKPPGKIGTW
ncbi:MAG: hypothetical protein LBC59_06335 [Chitinispirillales bacterium]|nr:hypothetical protein [Chitinispirillales bacterium]